MFKNTIQSICKIRGEKKEVANNTSYLLKFSAYDSKTKKSIFFSGFISKARYDKIEPYIKFETKNNTEESINYYLVTGTVIENNKVDSYNGVNTVNYTISINDFDFIPSTKSELDNKETKKVDKAPLVDKATSDNLDFF